MRVFIGLIEISGYYSGLKRGFDELGVDATFVSLTEHPFKYHDVETSNRLIRMMKDAGERAAATPRSNLPLKVWRALKFRALFFSFFVWALLNHDAFIFGQMSSFYKHRELPVLKLFGKKIVHVCHGGDTRPPYVCGAFIFAHEDWPAERWVEFTRQRKRTIRTIERYADALVSHVNFAQFAEKPCVSFLRVGIPLRPGGDLPRGGGRAAKGRAPRLVHCPSHLQVKGTEQIRRAIESLRARGHRFEYVEVSGQPNRVVLEEIMKSDFVVDQLYADYPMAGLPTEAAFLGKPSVVGGYVAGAAEGGDVVPPSLFCHPDDIEAAIEKLLLDAEFRAELGERARRFVEENWTPAAVAANYLRIIRGDVPRGWLFDPRTSRNVYGCGLPEERARQMVRKVIEGGGREALQLSDKPELEATFVEFAYSRPGGGPAENA